MKLSDLITDIKSYQAYDKTHYHELQVRSSLIDTLLGFNIENIEEELIHNAQINYPKGNYKTWGKSIYNGSEAWIGLSSEQLQTTYYEFFDVINRINVSEEETFCDLGAGYGRLGFLLRLLERNNAFLGVELVEQRVNEAKRLIDLYGYKDIRMVCSDLKEFPIPFYDNYFIYDFGVISQMNYVLEKLAVLSYKNKFRIIARGRGIRTLIENKHPWLAAIEPTYTDTYAIFYTSESLKKD